MKSPTVLFILLCTMLTCVYAQGAHESVAVDFKGVTVSFQGDPQGADAKLLPFIDGRGTSGTKERFGFCLGGTSTSAQAIEILDKDGKLLKTVSVGELLGGKGSGFSFVSKASTPRWMEKKYSLDLGKNSVQLLVKALATGTSPADEHLVVTFALRCETASTLSLRIHLPGAGNLEARSGGLVLSAKNGSGAIAAAVYPGSASATVSKGTATLSSGTVSLEPGKESALLWLVLDGVTATASGGSKEAAARLLREKRFGERDPHIVIVSNTDKPSTQPGDVVTYSLLCRNIGTAEATDVTLSNPVSEGLQYLEGSATTEGSSVTFDQKGASGAVRNINWKFSNPIKPGEERQVAFKVKVL